MITKGIIFILHECYVIRLRMDGSRCTSLKDNYLQSHPKSPKKTGVFEHTKSEVPHVVVGASVILLGGPDLWNHLPED